jgi:hypothetical protein
MRKNWFMGLASVVFLNLLDERGLVPFSSKAMRRTPSIKQGT